tara:strand:+ start:3332 stop:4147 length:816 start_codon:yes stop_codon:yes gene_type:complete
MSIFGILIIIALILVLVFAISMWFFKSNIIFDKLLVANADTTSDNTIENDVFNDNETANFMLSVWFYVDNWGNKIGNEKNILYMSSTANSITNSDLQNTMTGISTLSGNVNEKNSLKYKNLSISLDKYQNNLFIDIETYSDTGKAVYVRYIIKNIAIQKWNCVTLSVDTKTLDVYLDGKLRNSFILPNLYRNALTNDATKNIYLGKSATNVSSFQGFITRVRYETNSINPETAYNIYKEGIDANTASSLLDKYGLKVAFTEYGDIKGEFQI